MSQESSYVYPVVYYGPKEAKTFTPSGPVKRPVVFLRGEEADAFGGLPYAYVSEAEARYIIARSMGDDGPLFGFAVGRAPVSDNEALTKRVSELETRIEELEAKLFGGDDIEPAEEAEPVLTGKGKK